MLLLIVVVRSAALFVTCVCEWQAVVHVMVHKHWVHDMLGSGHERVGSFGLGVALPSLSSHGGCRVSTWQTIHDSFPCGRA
jgi:hypothetical protein